MRAYHRVDPLMDERKSHYSPAQFGAFLKVQLVAGRQARRGWFRSEAALRGTLPASYARHIDFLIREGDLVPLDGGVQVDGWDEWQEGDLTVGDRMARLRNRRRNAAVTSTVTPVVTQASPSANAYAKAEVEEAGVGSGEGLPNIDADAITFLEGLTGRLIRQAGDRNLGEYDRQIQDHGFQAVVRAYSKASKSLPTSPKPTARQLVWSARNILEPFADTKSAEAAERQDEEAQAHQRRLDVTRRKVAEEREAIAARGRTA